MLTVTVGYRNDRAAPVGIVCGQINFSIIKFRVAAFICNGNVINGSHCPEIYHKFKVFLDCRLKPCKRIVFSIKHIFYGAFVQGIKLRAVRKQIRINCPCKSRHGKGIDCNVCGLSGFIVKTDIARRLAIWIIWHICPYKAVYRILEGQTCGSSNIADDCVNG